MKTELTFPDFILKQATNAGIFLGQRENPLTGEKNVNLKAAKGCLDILLLMQDKTAGNLDLSEQKLLDDTVITLRDLYQKTTEIEPNV